MFSAGKVQSRQSLSIPFVSPVVSGAPPCALRLGCVSCEYAIFVPAEVTMGTAWTLRRRSVRWPTLRSYTPTEPPEQKRDEELTNGLKQVIAKLATLEYSLRS